MGGAVIQNSTASDSGMTVHDVTIDGNRANQLGSGSTGIFVWGPKF
jgi:hypothetical protein